MKNTMTKIVNKGPEGGIDGLFTVGRGKKVFFSKGHLQYQPSTKTWRFAEHQTDLPTKDKDLDFGYDVKPNYKGWVDLFGWGTGIDPIGSPDDFDSRGGYREWGENPILNGGNKPGLWRALSSEEWDYMLYRRRTQSGIRFIRATVGKVTGLILVPNDWDGDFEFNNPDDFGSEFSDDVITKTQWKALEKEGMVFLPSGHPEAYMYWTSTRGVGREYGAAIVISESQLFVEDEAERYFDCIVRLVSK